MNQSLWKGEFFDMKKYVGFYFSYSLIPELSANSIAVVNQYSALRKHEKILLFGIRNPKLSRENLRKFYNIDTDLDIVLLPKLVMNFSYFFYSVIALIYYFRYRPAFIYTRDIYISRLFCLVGIDNYYEIHQLDHNDDAFDKKFKHMLSRVKESIYLKKVICVSYALKSECEQFGFYPDKLTVFHSATGMTQDKNLLKEGNPNDRPKIVYTGSTQNGKGVETVNSLAELLPEYDFIVVGGQKGDLHNQSNMNLTHIPWISPGEVKRYLSLADVCLLPNTVQKYKFHSPLKLFDYMAHGKAIVASDMVGINEIIIDKYNGMLVAPGDVFGYAEAIRTLLSDGELKSTIESNALETTKKYTWDRRALSILELVRSVC